VGRAFVRVLSDLSHKPTDGLNIGLGRDMRLTAPELSAMYREGMMAEGAHVIDAGQVGTEMLYFLVGSRGLDGGLMCTASHNPKEYTGAKLVREGAIALSGDQGIQDIRALDRGGLGDGRTHGARRRRRRLRRVPRRGAEFIDPANVKPLKVVVDGGNGMAADGRPAARPAPVELVEAALGARRRHARRRAQPAARAQPQARHRHRPRDRRRPRHRLGRRRRPVLLHRRHGRVRRRRLPHRDPRRAPAGQEPRGGDPLRRPRVAGGRDRVEAAGGSAHVNRVGHAFFKTRMRDEGAIFGGEVSGHYYFRDFYNADSGTVPRCSSREALGRGPQPVVADGRLPLDLLHLGEINSTVEDGEAKMAELEAKYGEAAGGRVTKLDGVSIDYDDWHFNVRPSNTEPLLRLNLESLVSREDMERRRDELLGLIRG
jgi:phosphomannomutase